MPHSLLSHSAPHAVTGRILRRLSPGVHPQSWGAGLQSEAPTQSCSPARQGAAGAQTKQRQRETVRVAAKPAQKPGATAHATSAASSHSRSASTTSAAPTRSVANGDGVAAPSSRSTLNGDTVEGYRARVAECNQGLEHKSEFHPIVAQSAVLGYVHHKLWSLLQRFPDVFLPSKATAADDSSLSPSAHPRHPISLAPRLLQASTEERTAAVGEVLLQLREEGLVPAWRDELYPVGTSFDAEPFFLIERAAAPLLGVTAYGVHINGFVQSGPSPSDIQLWVAKRSLEKPTYPGKLDHLAAGGQPYNLSCGANVVKECAEEASVPQVLATKAVAVGAVSYANIRNQRMTRGVLFCFDLELPSDFIPRNADGEVHSFELVPISEAARIVRETREYKSNCNIVLIDFLIRHGFITPDQPGYLSLLGSLRQGICL